MKYLKQNLIFIAVISLIIGCSDMDESYEKFVEKGERIYAGKVDSLVVNGGKNRVQVIGWMHYANTAEKCIIRWSKNNVSDSIIVPASNWLATDTMKVIISGLDEGAQRLFVQTYDKEGHSSLNVECNGYTYGEEYILSSTPKSISAMKPELDGMILTWNNSTDAIFVELRYESNDGVKSLNLPGDVKTTTLPDWKLGGLIECRSALLPEPQAIDTLYTNWASMQFPETVEYELLKSKIVPLKLPFDATTGYSGKIEGVFDGVIGTGGNQFHSGDKVGVPQHLTFDLGVVANLTKFEIWARSDTYHNWNPKIIQMWGTDVLDDANKITLESSNANWESEAKAKGWTLLTEHTCTDPINNKVNITSQKKVRYIIVRTTQVHGAPASGSGAYVIIKEMTLFANSISNTN